MDFLEVGPKAKHIGMPFQDEHPDRSAERGQRAGEVIDQLTIDRVVRAGPIDLNRTYDVLNAHPDGFIRFRHDTHSYSR